ncbi:MAG: hypothetical protein V1722_04390 [Candidatus Micrarchaeota archaeon]
MTMTGDDIVQNCRECFFQNGYGIKLNPNGNILVCPHDSNHRYEVRSGMLERV